MMVTARSDGNEKFLYWELIEFRQMRKCLIQQVFRETRPRHATGFPDFARVWIWEG